MPDHTCAGIFACLFTARAHGEGWPPMPKQFLSRREFLGLAGVATAASLLAACAAAPTQPAATIAPAPTAPRPPATTAPAPTTSAVAPTPATAAPAPPAP